MPNISNQHTRLLTIVLGVILIVAGIGNVIISKKKEANQQLDLAQIIKEVDDNVYLPPETPFFIEKTLDYYEEVLGYTDSWSLHVNYLHRLTEGERYEEAIRLVQDIAQTADESEVKKHLYPLLIINYVKLGLKENCACTPCTAPLKEYTFSKVDNFQKAYDLLHEIPHLGKPLLSGYLLYPTSALYTWRKGELLNFLNNALRIKEKGKVEQKKRTSSNNDSITINPFQNITAEAGLAMLTEAGSSVIEDFNNDGHLDLAIVYMGMKSQMKYFENDGHGRFADKTTAAGLTGLLGGTHIVQTDYNNDDWLDIFITRGGLYGRYGLIPNSLLKNNGDGTFTDVTRAAGLFTKYPALTAVWADFNKDGWLDLFVGNDDVLKMKIHSEFYLNNGDGTFRDVTETVGLTFRNQVRSALPIDYDKDGDRDLFISFYDRPNVLFQNNNSAFSKMNSTKRASRTPSSGSSKSFRINNIEGKTSLLFTKVKTDKLPNPEKISEHYFNAIFDYNNDGDEDIFYSTKIRRFNQKGSTYFTVLDNQAEKGFVKKDDLLNIESDVIGLAQGDFNNDGFIDLFKASENLKPNKMLFNNQGKGFQDVTINAGIGNYIQGNGVSLGDIDNDGDLDLYIVNGGYVFTDKACDALWENTLDSSNWISLKLEGVVANKAAIGTTVEVTISEKGKPSKLYRTVNVGSSLGSSALRQHIGLGTAEKIESIKINWFGSDAIQVFEHVSMNQHYQLTEGSKLVKRPH